MNEPLRKNTSIGCLGAPVSVLIPTYNRPTLLERALRCVIKQTFADFEIVVADNSTDDSAIDIVKGVNDSRIRYLRTGTNIGTMPNVYGGLEACTSELIAVLHDDDTWFPDFLISLVPPLLADPTVSMSYIIPDIVALDGMSFPGARDRFIRNSDLVGVATGATTESVVPLVIRGASQTFAVFRREYLPGAQLIARNDVNYDIWFAMLAVRSSRKVWFDASVLANRTAHAGQQSTGIRNDAILVKVLEFAKVEPAFETHRAEIRKQIGLVKLNSGCRMLAAGNPSEARPLLVDALRLVPQFSAVAALLLSVTPGGTRIASSRWSVDPQHDAVF